MNIKVYVMHIPIKTPNSNWKGKFHLYLDSLSPSNQLYRFLSLVLLTRLLHDLNLAILCCCSFYES